MIWPPILFLFGWLYPSAVTLAVAAKLTNQVIQRYQAKGQNKYEGYADQLILLHNAASRVAAVRGSAGRLDNRDSIRLTPVA
jgi:hypothetical protein